MNSTANSTVRIAFKVSKSLPDRDSSCYSIFNGTLFTKCKNPGFEVEIMLLLLKFLKLKPHWLEANDGKTARSLLHFGAADMIGNIKGQDNLMDGLHISSSAVIYETNVVVIRKPKVGEWNSDGAFVKPFKFEALLAFAFTLAGCVLTRKLSLSVTMSTAMKNSKFYGFRTPLCNLRYSSFKLDGVDYHSVEQYAAAKKAELFKDPEAQTKIMTLKIPIECRRVKIKNYDQTEWEKIAEKVMWEGMMAKFLQNQGCRKYLIKTEGSNLVYCDPSDSFLGIGFDRFSEESNQPEKWGQNKLGVTLMKIRENIIGRAEYQDELQEIRKEVKKTQSEKKC